MKSKEKVMDILETILIKQKEAKKIKDELHEYFQIQEEIHQSIISRNNIRKNLNESINGMMYVDKVTRGYYEYKETEGRGSEVFVYNYDSLFSFSFHNHKIKIPTDKKEQVVLPNLSTQENISEITSNEYISNFLLEKEEEKTKEEIYKIYARLHDKERELHNVEYQIKKYNSKIRFSLFNKKALSLKKEELIQKRTEIENEITELRKEYDGMQYIKESLARKYAKFVPSDEDRQKFKKQFLDEYNLISNNINEYNDRLNQEKAKDDYCKKNYSEEKIENMKAKAKDIFSSVERLSEHMASDPEVTDILKSIIEDNDYRDEVKNLATSIFSQANEKKATQSVSKVKN